MSIDLDAVRTAGRKAAELPAAPRKGAPAPLTRASFGRAVVVAFDQTVSACGMVVVDSRGTDISIMRARKFEQSTRPGAEGYEVYFDKAEQLGWVLAEELAKLACSFPGIEVVHEAPPVGGGKFTNPESSLMAGREVRRAARAAGLTIFPMVAPQAHKRLIVGNAQATKKDVRAALPPFLASVGVTGYNLVTNEDQRDALCIALGHLHRRGAA